MSPDCPKCSVERWLTGENGGPADGVPAYPSGSFALSTVNGRMEMNGRSPDWRHLCTGGSDAIDREGCSSKAIRRTVTITDNGDGTITTAMPQLGEAWTVSGSFPKRFDVVFKDHNYTPLKDGPVVGHTWHWDNIIVS